MPTKKSTFLFAFKSSLPILAGYIVLGMGFGVLLASKGYSFWWALLMSVTMYSGSMQYVGVNLLASGATLLSAALVTLMVNLRHFFYGITMLKGYRDVGPTKPYLIFSLTDETFSLVCTAKLPETVDRRGFYFFVSLLDQLYWITGCVLGAVLGNLIPFNATGIDFSMTALFAVIFIEQWETTRQHLPALTGLVISLVCLVVCGAENFLIPAMVLITIALFIEKRWMKEENA